jgi:hypothetical protein
MAGVDLTTHNFAGGHGATGPRGQSKFFSITLYHGGIRYHDPIFTWDMGTLFFLFVLFLSRLPIEHRDIFI